MTENARTREEVYAAVRETSRDEVILEEMIRLGFWPAKDKLPEDPADEIRRRGELQREISELRAKNRKLNNEEALIKEARKQRLAECRDCLSRRRRFGSSQPNRVRRSAAGKLRLAAPGDSPGDCQGNGHHG
jgi:hypothetical protein